MAKRIALFNHKGGVSKTTTTFNLGWMLAQKGKRVILVDTDPQCNLTGMVLEYTDITELEKFYEQEPERNLKSGLAPAFQSRPVPLKAVDCVPVDRQEDLFLLPGHIQLSEYEVTLGFAQELSSSIQALQNLPGSIAFLLDKTSEEFRADYVLIDMNPSLSSINQNLLMISDFFIVPTSPDYFSAMAIDSLKTVLPKWHSWAKKASSLPILKEAVYPFPEPSVKFLGTIIQNYRLRGGVATSGFQEWIDRIHSNVNEKLVPALSQNDMMLSEDVYERQKVEDFCLASIPDFNTLIATSQKHRTPVFALDVKQLDQTGVVLKTTQAKQVEFRRIFSELVDRIIEMTSNEGSN